MVKILISDKYAAEGIEMLSSHEGFEVDVQISLTVEEIKNIIKDYDALLIRSATKPNKEILENAHKLKLIVRAGEGTDNIDKSFAAEKGIIVENTPGQNSHAVCELTIGLLFSLARHIPKANASTKKGKWEKKKLMGTELKGKTLGLIGSGKIGSDVGNTAIALGMKVICYEKLQDIDFEKATFDELLMTSDFISIHVSLTDDTKNMIGEHELAKMKSTAYIINCARGGIIDEQAVASAVLNGKIAGAAFDCYTKEPPEADNPLLEIENIICIPHLGASSKEAQVNCATAAARQVIAYFDKNEILNRVQS